MPAIYSDDQDCQQAINACFSLIRASERIQNQLGDVLRNSNITLPQWNVLDCLYWGGPMKNRDIALHIEKSDGNISFILDRLEKEGLIERCRSTEDRRQLHVALSADGRDAYATILPDITSRISELFADISRSQRKTLLALTHAVGDTCQAENSSKE